MTTERVGRVRQSETAPPGPEPRSNPIVAVAVRGPRSRPRPGQPDQRRYREPPARSDKDLAKTEL
eukprot:13937212-Heterocapsa_arctica.AAC.1